MVATTSVDIGTLITKSPDIWHGMPVISGTRVTVMGIVGMHQEGATPEDIARRKDLGLAEVYAALAYYYANQKQVDRDIAEEQADYDEAASQWQEQERRGKQD